MLEMWFLRRELVIPFTAKKTNVEVMEGVGQTKSLVYVTRKLQAAFIQSLVT